MLSSLKMLDASCYKEVFLLFFLAICSAWPATQEKDTVRLAGNSDWWSLNRTSEPDELKAQEREFPSSTFQVLGVNLAEMMLGQASTKLGEAALIRRGDASTGRLQACYVSSGAVEKVHLIFEEGEVGFAFYIFVGGPSWEGSDRCMPSKEVSDTLTTASGLHLGQTPTQVTTILGKPTMQRKNEFVYFFSVRKKASSVHLKEARRLHPQMTDEDLQENFGSYDLTASVHVKFVKSKLTYLAVTKVESN